MENPGKKLEVFIIVSVIALIGIVYAFRQKPALAPSNNSTITLTDQDSNLPLLGQTAVGPVSGDSASKPQLQVPGNIVEYQGRDGKNALELLESSHRVDAKHYSFGDLVTGIDGIAPDAKHFWAMYVNGKFSQLGASVYITKSTDTIKWQIDAVIDTTK